MGNAQSNKPPIELLHLVNIVDNSHSQEQSADPTSAVDKRKSSDICLQSSDIAENVSEKRVKCDHARVSKKKIQPPAPITSSLLLLLAEPHISVNNKLLVAKCSNFANESECNIFTSELITMIMKTDTYIDLRDKICICRFLEIYITADNNIFLKKLTRSRTKYTEWIEPDLFKNKSNRSLLQKLLSMIKQQKELINVDGGVRFVVELFLNRRQQVGNREDTFHADLDIFTQENPRYLSSTNISQTGYGLSTEIKSSDGRQSYTFLTNPCESVVLDNKLLIHRTPLSAQIEESKYSEVGEIHRQSGLKLNDFNTPIIKQLNKNIQNNDDPRHILRMVIFPTQEDLDDLNDTSEYKNVTHLVQPKIRARNVVTYKFQKFDRPVNAGDTHKMLELSLKNHSLGGKSKKKRHKKTNTKKCKSYKQRGGIIKYFAVYAENSEILDLIEKNVYVSL